MNTNRSTGAFLAVGVVFLALIAPGLHAWGAYAAAESIRGDGGTALYVISWISTFFGGLLVALALRSIGETVDKWHNTLQ